MADGFSLETLWVRRRGRLQGYYAPLVTAYVDEAAVTIWQGFLWPAASLPGDMVGTATITFTPSATLTGAGALTGTTALVFTPSGTLTGRGALTGSSTLTFSPSGTLAGEGALSGSASVTLTPAGTLTGSGALVGTAPITFTLSATADVPASLTQIEGSTGFSFTLSGTLRTYQYLHVIIESPGTVTPVAAAPAGTITDIPVPSAQILPLAQAA